MNPPDAGPGGTASSLTCGTTACAIPAQTCCVEQATAGLAFSCTAAGAPCAGADAGQNGNNGDTVSLKCSGAANCAAGTVCCVQQVNNGAASECKAACGQNEAQLCDKNATPTGCTAGVNCSSNNIGDWSLPRTYATCGGKGN